MGRLDAVDLSQTLSRRQQDTRLTAGGKRLGELRLALAGKLPATPGQPPRLGPPVLVLFEGWDAAGKGGAIKRLVAPLDQRHVRVTSFGAPSPDELRHHYLLRFAPKLPGRGGMAIFDRTWYGRVLVERVEQLIAAEAWRRAYDEIAGLERGLVL